MDGKIGGMRALVTGASSGIGAELAKVLAEHGTHLVLVARREERLRALARELEERHGIETRVEACDLADEEATTALLERLGDLPIDILVNNAGLGRYETFVNTDWPELQTQLAVNLVSLTRLTHHFVPKMIERGRGHVMNVASIGAYTPTPNFTVYAATKAYVRHLTESLDYELSGTGVRAICVNPGGTKTEFVNHAQQVLKPSSEKFMMSARECARISVAKMLAGRRNVVTGRMNALGMWLLRFLPRSVYPKLADKAMSSSVDKAG